MRRILYWAITTALTGLGCGSSDPTGSGGRGTIVFTTWGEDFVEREIPAESGDNDGFVDGWTLRYDRFLVNFQNIVVADAGGEVAATMPASRLVDNKLPGVKAVVTFEDVPAKAWQNVSYQIAPVTAETELADGVAESDKALMLDGGFSLYLAGTASKEAVEKRFAWGFTTATQYQACQSELDGRLEHGLVVRNNASVEAQLTTHGDHPFYDRLQASPDPAVETSLRFDAIAEADADGDGEVTMSELDATLVDVTRYTTFGDVATLGQFMTFLTRTIGHFRGEGECSVRNL